MDNDDIVLLPAEFPLRDLVTDGFHDVYAAGCVRLYAQDNQIDGHIIVVDLRDMRPLTHATTVAQMRSLGIRSVAVYVCNGAELSALFRRVAESRRVSPDYLLYDVYMRYADCPEVQRCVL